MSSHLQLKTLFEHPPVQYRSVPFWAWNDILQQEELERQIEGMKQQGMGGFFMHSRVGLETPYMGEEWMESIKAATEKARQLGLRPWLYDEDRWPSGFAGGIVPQQGDSFRAKGLTLELLASALPETILAESNIAAIYRAEVAGRSIIRCQRVAVKQAYEDELEEAEAWLVFRIEVSKASDWFNGEAPPDQLNPGTVEAFIAATHEKYKAALGDLSEAGIAGIFTDEPSVHDRHCRFTAGRGWIPWTFLFADYFREMRDYDIFDVLPYIFFNGEHSYRARHDYWRTVTELFCEAFTKQLSQWCERNGIDFTGHFLWEDALGVATRVSGAIMPHYRYQHVPGIDMLCEQTDEYLTVKQCTSVANQFGRPFVLTETYGCTGWAFSFEGQRWIGDWQYVLGVNVRSQHLALYSLKGCRKRDYPPVFNYQANWWPYNYLIEDYYARLGAVLSEGRPIRQLLVLHPATSAWAMLGTTPYENERRGLDEDIPAVNQFGYEFNHLLKQLLAAHYDFDLGDEMIMSESASIRGAEICIEQAAYQLIVLPPMLSMLESTYELLLAFLQAGGMIIAQIPTAWLIEGRAEANKLEQLYSHAGMTIVNSNEQLVQMLPHKLPRMISIKNRQGDEAEQVLAMLRRREDGYTLFVVNNDRTQGCKIQISLPFEGDVEGWDAYTGQVHSVVFETDAGGLQFAAELGAADSKLYVIYDERPERMESIPASVATETNQAPPSEFLIAGIDATRRTMPNALPLNRCSYQIANGQWSEEMQVWAAQRAIRTALGMRQIMSNGGEQRYRWIHEDHSRNGTSVSLKFHFEAAWLPEEAVHLVLENAKRFQIKLNGQVLPNAVDGWFMDRSFDTVPIHGLKLGSNSLELTCSYQLASELEDCYLIGEFGVSPFRMIEREKEAIELGDWGLQGYFHYNGSLVYEVSFELEHEQWLSGGTKLFIGKFEAVLVIVRVNGEAAGSIPWRAADGLDITAHLKYGHNRMEIEVVGSPRNMLGPFHQAGGEGKTTSSESFQCEGETYSPAYHTRPYGLFEKPRLVRIT